MRRSLIALATILTTACAGTASGPSPAATTASPPAPDIVLSNFTVTPNRFASGDELIYTVCGSIARGSIAFDDITLRGLTFAIRDGSGQTFLTGSSPTSFSKPLVPGGVDGCFGTTTDPDTKRPAGATFFVQIAYSRSDGQTRTIETSGSIPTFPDVVLSHFTVTSSRFATGGGGLIYTVCGTIARGPLTYDDITTRGLTLAIRDGSGQTFLTWSAPSSFSQPLLPGGFGGCFGSTTDPDPKRSVGATFFVQIAYSRSDGQTHTLETSGPIAGTTIIQSTQAAKRRGLS